MTPPPCSPSKLNEVVKFCWLTEHLFSTMIVVIGKRGWDKIPADLRPAVQKAARGSHHPSARTGGGKGRRSDCRIGPSWALSSTPMAKAERDSVRKEMETRLWPASPKTSR